MDLERVCDTETVASYIFSKSGVNDTYQRVCDTNRDMREMNKLIQTALRHPELELLDSKQYIEYAVVPYMVALRSLATQMTSTALATAEQLSQYDFLIAVEERDLATTRFNAARNILAGTAKEFDGTLTSLLTYTGIDSKDSAKLSLAQAHRRFETWIAQSSLRAYK